MASALFGVKGLSLAVADATVMVSQRKEDEG
jgi:hypothetical protein